MFESIKVSIKNIRCKSSCCSKINNDVDSSQPSRQSSKGSKSSGNIKNHSNDDIIAERIPSQTSSK